MKFGHIEILAQNPKQTQQFYCDVFGFEIETIQNNEFIWLKKGQLDSDNVDESLAMLKEKGVEIKGTVDSSKCYTFTDPDGNWFQLVNPNDH